MSKNRRCPLSAVIRRLRSPMYSERTRLPRHTSEVSQKEDNIALVFRNRSWIVIITTTFFTPTSLN